MSQDRPDAANLVETVSAFLRELMPRVEGQDRFYTRVSIHLLDMVARELRAAPRYDAEERKRLTELLGHEGPLEALNVELAAAIREGALDDRGADVFAHTLRTIEDKLRIVNPRHLEPAKGET